QRFILTSAGRRKPKADAETAVFNSYPKSTALRPAIRLSDRHSGDHVSVAGERRCLGSSSYRHSETERKNCRAREDSHENSRRQRAVKDQQRCSRLLVAGTACGSCSLAPDI